MLKVYGDTASGNCYKVKLLLEQLRLPYTWIAVDILKNESRTGEFLQKNPSGQIPLLEISPGTYLPESNAILHYLADGSDFLPRDPLEHAQVLRWMFWEQYSHEPNIASARFIVRYLGNPPERAEILKRKIADGHEALQLMDRHLERNKYLVGERYTIADIALYAYAHVAEEGRISLAPYASVRRWLDEVRTQQNHVAM